jgi:hypothetical protein
MRNLEKWVLKEKQKRFINYAAALAVLCGSAWSIGYGLGALETELLIGTSFLVIGAILLVAGIRFLQTIDTKKLF